MKYHGYDKEIFWVLSGYNMGFRPMLYPDNTRVIPMLYPAYLIVFEVYSFKSFDDF